MQKLRESVRPITAQDEHGKMVAALVRANSIRELTGNRPGIDVSALNPPVSEEELDRRWANREPGRTTAEVLERPRKLP